MATSFTLRTARGLLQKMINRVVATSPLTDINDGSEIKQVLAAVARIGEMLSFDTARLLTLFSLDNAEGVDLDDRAREYMPDGFEREPATRAQGTVRFTRTAGASAIPIPVGTAVARTSGNQRIIYETTAPGEIPAGPEGTISARTDGGVGDIPIRARQPGASGTTGVGTITEMVTTIPGVLSITNPTQATGSDAESDDAFRARIRTRTRNLSRCTPEALEARALEAEVDGRRLTTAKSFRTPGRPGHATLYVDDGTGSAREVADVDAEVLIDSATGGERRFYTRRYPWDGEDWTVTYTPNGLAPIELTKGADYNVIAPAGLIELSASALAFPDGLSAGDSIEVGPYTVRTGLVAEAQRLIDGDPDDPESYPTWRAEGVVIEVTTPTIIWVDVEAAVVAVEGYNAATVRQRAVDAITGYLQELAIGEDAIFHKLVERVMAVEGVYNVVFTTPTENQPIGDTEMARPLSIEVS